MFAGIGSTRIAARSGSAVRSQVLAMSFQGATAVAAAAAAGTPGLAGIPCVASPDPASASRPSTWPW